MSDTFTSSIFDDDFEDEDDEQMASSLARSPYAAEFGFGLSTSPQKPQDREMNTGDNMDTGICFQKKEPGESSQQQQFHFYTRADDSEPITSSQFDRNVGHEKQPDNGGQAPQAAESTPANKGPHIILIYRNDISTYTPYSSISSLAPSIN